MQQHHEKQEDENEVPEQEQEQDMRTLEEEIQELIRLLKQ